MDRLAAARIGGGSDVLGYDDEYSRQGQWGPTFQLLLPDEEHDQVGPSIREVLYRNLPAEFEGYPTAPQGGPSIDVFGFRGYMRERLGISCFPENQLDWTGSEYPSPRSASSLGARYSTTRATS